MEGCPSARGKQKRHHQPRRSSRRIRAKLFRKIAPSRLQPVHLLRALGREDNDASVAFHGVILIKRTAQVFGEKRHVRNSRIVSPENAEIEANIQKMLHSRVASIPCRKRWILEGFSRVGAATGIVATD